MGFGGGAFGTGSYTYSVIDDETIKLNQQKGVIYANQSALTPDTDNNTIYLNSNNQLAVKPSSITQFTSNPLNNNITISSNTTLTSDLYCNNLTINSGVVLTTNGYNIYCAGTFTNNGTINTGYQNNAGNPNGSLSGGSVPNSYAGSGGGSINGTGGSTLASGGSQGNPAGNGSTPSAPTLSNSIIRNWYGYGFINYLSGGGGAYGGSGGSGGNGAYGICIQANEIIAGTINANGQSGTGNSSSGYYGGGGGGGGIILLVYGSGGYTAGTYNVSGGSGGVGGSGTGGNGGNGQILTYNYSEPPVPIITFTYSTTNGIKNRNSSYQYTLLNTTSTSPTTIISQSFTPQYTGLVKIKAVVQVYNNTAGNGVFVGLYNGSSLLDNETLISSSANQQQIAYLYNEILYSAPFSQQAFSIQFNAVGGGTAYAEIQEFTIEEVY